MRRRTRLNLMLAGVALVLGALALASYRRELARAPGTLLALDPAAVDAITVEFPAHAAARFHRTAGGWVDAAGQAADAGWLADLASTARAPVLQWRPAADFDPARIGLDPPLARLRLDDTWLEFGTDTATGPQCYVRVGGRIALVPLRFRPRPPRNQLERLD